MNKGKISVSTQLEDTKALADAESKDRSSLLTKYKMMATDLENLREKMEKEAMRKSDALKALSKAQAEIQLWKSRFETEGMGRVEELEAARNKLQAKIVESEELVDVLTTKVANAEKSKTRMNNDLGLQLVAGGLKLFNAAHAFGFEARLPELDLGLSLGEGLQGIRLPHGFVLHLLPEVLKV